LIEALNDQQGDYLHEACAGALEAIGLAAVKPIIAHLRDDDLARRIYLTGVLGEIPTEDAAQALLDLLKDDRYPDEMHVNALTDIGSPSAIEPLYALSQAEHHRNQLLAESLLVLCQLNNVQKPELPQWRKIVRAEEIRLSRLSRGETAAIEKDEPIIQVAPPPSPSPPSERQPRQRSRRKPRSVSKAERKKRSAQRKRQKRGRK
jgi:HEAT repeat protein